MKLTTNNKYMSIKQGLIQVFNDVTVQFNVALSTIFAGLLTIFDLVAEHIGQMASFGGLVLTVVCIYMNLQNIKINRLQIDNLERRHEDKERARQEAIDQMNKE